jgi:long-chain acyl-CoA synthetase
MNVATNLEASTFYFPQRPALASGEKEITYAELNETTNRLATGLLKMGLRPGEHVAICAPNTPEWPVTYLAILKAGGVVISLANLLSPDELRMLLEHSKPRFFFTNSQRLRDIDGLRGSQGIEKVICPEGDITFDHVVASGAPSFRSIDRDRTDTAVILYTGGTTGIPKGVMLTHENVNQPAHNVAFCERTTERDRALCALPLHHVFAVVHIMTSTIMSGACLEILPGFDLDTVLSLIDAGQVTKFFAVPTVYTRFVTLDRLEHIMRNIRYCFCSGSAIAVEIMRQWKERTGLDMHEGYGMTETASAVTFNHMHRHIPGSVGTVVPGCEVQIRDAAGNILPDGKEGEVCMRGPNIMKGYLNNPEATAETFWKTGWLRSGDVGVLDKDGYLTIVDRLKDLIITGGENVYPREVEEAIYLNSEVAECSVIGVPDKSWGERVVAYVIPKTDASITAEGLKAFLKARLAPYKVPKEYVFAAEFPKSTAGKVLKREIKRQHLEKKEIGG